MQPEQQGLSAAWDELTEQSHDQHHTALGLEVCWGWQLVLIHAVVRAEQIKIFLAMQYVSVSSLCQ